MDEISDDTGPEAVVWAYHRRTKHHLNRYARSPGSLDWSTEPNPFRTFQPAPRIDLPLLADRIETPFANVYQRGGGLSKP